MTQTRTPRLGVNMIAGMSALIIAVPTIFFAQVLLQEQNAIPFVGEVFLAIILVILCSVMLYGFVIIGRMHRRHDVVVATYVMIGVMLLLFIPEMLLMHITLSADVKMIFYRAVAIIYGGALIYFGAKTLSLCAVFGSLARAMSLCCIISGILFCSVVLLVFAMPFLFAGSVLALSLFYLATTRTQGKMRACNP